MGLFRKNKDNKDFTIKFAHLDGIPNYKEGFSIKATLDDKEENLLIEPLVERKDSVKLKYSQIRNILLTSDKEIIEKSKSVAGRSVLGGVFIGPLGAIVGSISGVGNKQKTKVRNIIVINYRSCKDDEDKVLSLEIVGATFKWDKFIKLIEDRANIQNKIETAEYL